MNLPIKTPKSTTRKWLWITAIILGVTLLVMVTALLRFKTEIAGGRLTATSATKTALPVESSP